MRVDGGRLRAAAAAILRGLGLAPADAATGADVLVRTDMRGVRSHGVRHLPAYARQIRAGGINAGAVRKLVVDTPSMATIDAGAGLGHVAASHATALAVNKALVSGIAIVTVRNSNHCGALGHYALACAEAGLIGLVVSNCPPIMNVPGARSRAIGNGPTAYGAPRAGGPPMVFDAALSTVAGGRVLMAMERGLRVPKGWIVDARGRPSTNPADLRAGGALLPAAGHKGYGLTLFGELLAGALSGAGMVSQIGANVTPDKPTDTGHAVVAIDPAKLTPDGSFAARVDELARLVKAAPLGEGAEEILVPGELEHREEQRTRAVGLELDGFIWDELETLAAEVGATSDLAAARL